MKEYRKIDDNIMLRLNTTNTHSEAACADFFKQLVDAYQKRERVVNKCLKVCDVSLVTYFFLLELIKFILDFRCRVRKKTKSIR